MKGHELGAISTACVNGVSTSHSETPAQAGSDREGLHEATTVNPDMIPVVVIAERRVAVVSAHVTNDSIGGPADAAAAGLEDRKGIIGRDDRAHHLALGSSVATPGLLSPKSPKAVTLPSILRRGRATAVKPHSRADDQERCGVSGYCDPWDENGCGGLYCGRRHERD